MNPTSKTFFKQLKELFGKIERDVADVKQSVYDIPNDESATKKIFEINDVIKLMRTEADALKSKLVSENTHAKKFCNDFEELILEVEDSVLKQEKYLEKYGYKSLEQIFENGISGSEAASCNTPPSLNLSRLNDQRTPDLLDYGIIPNKRSNKETSLSSNQTPEDVCPKLLLNKETENSDSTPVLDVNENLEKVEAQSSYEMPPTPTLVFPSKSRAS